MAGRRIEITRGALWDKKIEAAKDGVTLQWEVKDTDGVPVKLDVFAFGVRTVPEGYDLVISNNGHEPGDGESCTESPLVPVA